MGAVVDELRGFAARHARRGLFLDGKGRGIAAIRKEDRQAWIARLPSLLRRKAGALLRGERRRGTEGTP